MIPKAFLLFIFNFISLVSMQVNLDYVNIESNDGCIYTVERSIFKNSVLESVFNHDKCEKTQYKSDFLENFFRLLIAAKQVKKEHNGLKGQLYQLHYTCSWVNQLPENAQIRLYEMSDCYSIAPLALFLTHVLNYKTLLADHESKSIEKSIDSGYGIAIDQLPSNDNSNLIASNMQLLTLHDLKTKSKKSFADKIDLSSNLICNIRAGEFDKFYFLKHLNLSGNYLKKLPDFCFQGCKNLSVLFLSYNLLEEINPKAFEGLTNLKELYLMGNLIKKISGQSLKPLSALILLRLSCNKIVDCDELAINEFERIKDVYLDKNPLNEETKAHLKLKNLSYIFDLDEKKHISFLSEDSHAPTAHSWCTLL